MSERYVGEKGLPSLSNTLVNNLMTRFEEGVFDFLSERGFNAEGLIILDKKFFQLVEVVKKLFAGDFMVEDIVAKIGGDLIF